MNLLSAILPGVRGLRAPLAAGALLLLAGWLAIDPRLPDEAHSTGLYKSLLDLNDVVTIGVTAIAAFVASIVGAVVSTFAGMVVNWFLRSGWSKDLRDWIEEEERRLSPAVQARLRDSKRLGDRLDALKEKPSLNPLSYLPTGSHRAVLRLRQSEWRQLRFRLLQHQPAIYSEIDRLESEAEFRFAIALPVTLVGLAAAERATDANVAIAVGGVILGVLLARAGVAVSGATERTMVDLVLDRVVTLPVMDALTEDATDIGRRDRGSGDPVPPDHDPQ